MVEQRYQAVREVIDSGDSITDVAARYDVDRRTLRRWLTRHANGGLEAWPRARTSTTRVRTRWILSLKRPSWCCVASPALGTAHARDQVAR
jgi:transposase-like protein